MLLKDVGKTARVDALVREERRQRKQRAGGCFDATGKVAIEFFVTIKVKLMLDSEKLFINPDIMLEPPYKNPNLCLHKTRAKIKK
ncbi:hypothetical protein L596_028937 [Steinernema carpocapsae]|uniref:Uncharacterized protein n=1 Tax=Steinernema carpocapsae TaxID=34508 RepID=A0A4U5LZS9_STECR|nr:hypothetical protein L596_028937 [Steinernema carpocapsae]